MVDIIIDKWLQNPKGLLTFATILFPNSLTIPNRFFYQPTQS
jgi:hypothetical protein